MDGNGAYRVTHAAGYSTFVHEQDGIRTQLRLGVPEGAAAKLSVLRVTNVSSRARRLTLTAYAEWTLGARRDDSQYQIQTRYVPEHGAIVAQNHFDPLFTTWTAFLACSEPITSFTADRLAFLGRYGQLGAPAALRGGELDGANGVGLDPCAALQMRVTLMPGQSRDITVLLGAAKSKSEAYTTMERLRPVPAATAAIAESVNAWDTRLTTITVTTPDPAFDAMLNKWSLYQALSCRMWARMGLYQSSGAYGFRDQLQDSMAFLYAEPRLAREHILRAAARQFLEGDVQHWWHAHSGRGVRTKFSDDLVWLPFVVEQYVTVTGDGGLLDEYVPFITMRALAPQEHELYELPTVTDEHGSIYEHCRRALRRACTTGVHGLPLIGTGDWNDGMSRVGAEGKGESVWLAWFLIRTLRAFAKIADARGDDAEAAHMRYWSDRYTEAAEQAGWDGAWYRRAYYDNGNPIGSAQNDECRIDSIAQSWSVISGAAPMERQRMAMRAFNEQLVRQDARLIELLTPPFGGSDTDPGYIRGYLPGVRENGGQYTHAALWAVLATAMHGDGDRAFELFQMLNPFTHTSSADGVARYKVEPYVVAADVYSSPEHLGRGGWTWYTGSASWMYRVGLESLLGFTKVGDTLQLTPCVPHTWPGFQITYRMGRSTYAIDVSSPAGIQQHGPRVTLDGVVLAGAVLPLVDDGRHHIVLIQPETATP